MLVAFCTLRAILSSARGACDLFVMAGFVDAGMGPLLAFDDPLGCLACWDLFAEIFFKAIREGDAECISILQEWLEPKMEHVLQSFTSMDRTLQSGILKVVASIAGQMSTAGSPKMHFWKRSHGEVFRRQSTPTFLCCGFALARDSGTKFCRS